MRTFLAITPPEEVRDSLIDLQEGLLGANWSSEENLHLTLLFLGEQPRRALEDLDAALLQVAAAPFDLRLEGVGVFGGRDARLVFAGVADSPALLRLQSKIAIAAQRAEIEVDSRKYAPHVTLARWGRGRVSAEALAAYLSAHNLFASEAFTVSSYALYRSELSRSGAHYELLAEYPLHGASTAPGEPEAS